MVQVDIENTEQLITPKGVRSDSVKWSDQLNLNYSPTIIFFDEKGDEIIRIDSVVWLHRLERVLEYINSRSYKKYESFQAWRLAKSKLK